MQLSINNRLIKDSRALRQRNFQIDFTNWESSQGNAIKDHTDFTIYNVGDYLKSIGEICRLYIIKLNGGANSLLNKGGNMANVPALLKIKNHKKKNKKNRK